MTVLLALVRKTRCRRPQLRILLISGCATDPEEMAVADRFLPKPFSAKALVQAVRELEDAGQPSAQAPSQHPAWGWLA